MAKTSIYTRWIVIAAIVVAAGWLVVTWQSAGRASIVGYLAGVNLAAGLLYWLDKSAARDRAERIPEIVLHLVAALGGLPATVLAQQWLRHKTKKSSFRTATLLVLAAYYALALVGFRVLVDGHLWPGRGWGLLAAAAVFGVAVPVLNIVTVLASRPRRRKDRMPGWLWGLLVLIGGSIGPAMGGMIEKITYPKGKVRFVALAFAAHALGLAYLAWLGLRHLL